VMIGDTSFDMRMAANAGVRGFGVAWGYHPREELVASGAHAVADTYAHLAELLLDEGVDLAVYDRRRRAMARVLDAAGLAYALPRGAFYFFPAAPGGDDLAFTQRLLAENILAVPGRGFGFPGFFRLTFCVDEQIIERSGAGFKRATVNR